MTLELVLSYQQSLYAYRKRDGEPLSFGTQAQRMVPVVQLFSWLRRQRRIAVNPAADVLVSRPDRRLPEATLSADEMALLLGTPQVSKPLGLRDRAVLEVFYSCGLRRAELISLWLEHLSLERGTVFVRSGKGAKDRYVPIGERALFWLRLYVEIVRPGFVTSPVPRPPLPLVDRHPFVRGLALSKGAQVPSSRGHRQAWQLPSAAAHGGDTHARGRSRHPVCR